MASIIVNYKGLNVLQPDPVETGGLLLQNNIKTIADSLESIEEQLSLIHVEIDNAINTDDTQIIEGIKTFQDLRITTASNSQVLIVNSNGKIISSGKTISDIISESASPDLSNYYNKIQVDGYLGLLQSEITINENTILAHDIRISDLESISVSGDFITKTEVENISSNLQYQIDNISITGASGFIPEAGDGIIITPSGDDYIFSVDDYISFTEVENISSNLQYQIDNIIITPDVIGTGNIPITATESIIPSISGMYDLGSSEKPWRELYLIGNTIYMNNKPLSITGNRLTFDNLNTLAYTDEVQSVENSLGSITTITTSLSASKDYSYTMVNQSGHGFDILDAVYYDAHLEDGVFTNGFVYNHTIGSENVREATVGKEPYFTYNYSSNTYFMSCWGGRVGITPYSCYFLSKSGSGNGSLQSIIDATIGSVYYGGGGGMMIRSTTGALLFIALSGWTSGRSLNIKGFGGNTGDYSASAITGYTDFSNLRLKIEVSGNRVIPYYQRIGTDADFNQLGAGDTRLDYPAGTWDSYNIGFIIAGGSTASTPYEGVCTVREIDGSLAAEGGDNSTWEFAGGSLTGKPADGIVIEVPNNDTFKVATSGIITIPGSFTKGIPTYLSQTQAGKPTFARPTGALQTLWKGLNENNAQLILDVPPAGTIMYNDENNITSLIPEMSGSNLGVLSYPWNHIYANDVIVNGNSIFTFETTIESQVADISAYATSMALGVSGSTFAYQAEGDVSGILGDTKIDISSDYEFDENNSYSTDNKEYTCQFNGTYILQCDITLTINSAITNFGFRKNGSYLFSTGVLGSSTTQINKTRILTLEYGDVIDLYYDDNIGGISTISGMWYIHKL